VRFAKAFHQILPTYVLDYSAGIIAAAEVLMAPGVTQFTVTAGARIRQIE